MRYSIFSVQDHYPQAAPGVAERYAQLFAQAELGERLGYDTLFVAEHHFHDYGVVPNPAVMLAALAQRTSRLRLGPAIATLTYHNPLIVAENYAMVDVLSGGRLVLGVGSGYLKHEFAGFGIAPEEKRARFDESLLLVRRLLAGERVSHRGKFHNLDEVAINLRPIQRPTPPIYVAALAREAPYHIGRQGNRLMAVPYASLAALDEVGEFEREYRRGLAESGHAGSEDDAIYTFHCHVATSDEAARRDAAAAFDLYVETRLFARRQTYDDVLASGLALFGSPATVADKLVRLHRMGVRHLALMHDFGAMPLDRVRYSLASFAQEVMPRLDAALAAEEKARPARAAAPGG
jgi:alkanesulfonate monooxygenase SsuD/methylene tetrahydromethanopterin reductase-like flavin-dependent oxidoreductase (luciferase family)